jgi:all-trans-retinol dehydrogenase (NAD+)
MGLTGARKVTDYSASKHAVIGFSESLRQDLKDSQIHVSHFCLGLMNTKMFHGVTHKYPFFTPILDAGNVAQVMIETLESKRSQDVKMPFYVNLVSLLRFMPIEFADWIRNISGGNSDLDNR